MKRKIFGATLLVVLAVAAGWNFNQSKNEIKLNEIALANVEALASGESGGLDCASDYSGAYCGIFIDAAGNGTKVYYKG